jgi:predicted dehydrogenase
MGIVGMSSDHVWGMGDALASLPEVELVCAADAYPELCEQAQKRWKLARTYADYHDMLAKEKLDGILGCGDNASKVDVVAAAAQHKVHVYMDKPMAATLAQAERMVELAKAAGIVLMIAYHPYFRNAYTKARELVQTKIGQVYLARGLVGHSGPREVGCSKYFQEWLHDKQRNGGGSFVDEACYAISAFYDYVGPVTEVCAFMTQMGWRDYLPADVEDNAVAILRFKNGALGILDAKWGQIGPMPFGQSYHGTDGTVLTTWEGVKVYSRAVLPADLQGWVELGSGRPEPRNVSEAVYFVDAVLRGKPLLGPISPQGARDVQEIIEAAYRSAATGQVVKLPL